MAKLMGRCSATAVTDSLTTLIDWVNIQQGNGFEIVVKNVGGGTGSNITDVQIDTSSDGGTTSNLNDVTDAEMNITVPIAAAATQCSTAVFNKTDMTSGVTWLRVRATATVDTTVSCWLTATTTSNKTLDELATEARDICGVGADTELITATLAYSFLDRTQREIASRVEGLYDLHVESTSEISLVTDTKAYDISGLTYPLCHLYRVRMVDTSETVSPVTLDNRSFDQYRTDYPYPEQNTSGKPSEYTRIGNSLYIEAIPSSTYNGLPLYLDYGKWPARLTTSTDEPDIRNADELLILGAVYRIYRALGAGYRDQASQAQQDFEYGLEAWTEQQVTLLDWIPQMHDISEDLTP